MMTFEDLKAGDEVYFCSTFEVLKRQVTRTTNTQIVLDGGIRCRKIDGAVIGSDGAHIIELINERTTKKYIVYLQNRYVLAVANKLRTIGWADITFDKAQEINKVLGLGLEFKGLKK